MIGSAAQFGNTPPDVDPLPGEDYRRRARRLRHLYSKNPSLLHRRLSQLSESQRAGAKSEQPFAKTPSLAANSPAAWDFARQVAARLDAGGLLRYSHRTALFKEAHRLGIKRFEANLIIAVTQHRHRPLPANPAPSTAGPLPLPRWLLPITLALTLQLVLLALLFYTLS